MKVVHLAESDFHLRPIEPDGDNGVCKPKGGLWFSPVETRSWEEYCKDNWPSELEKARFEVTCELDEKNILKIESLDDINKLPFLPRQIRSMPTVDWQKLKQSGVDAVYLTERGYGIARSELFRNFGSKANCFYTWDVDSVVVLNERCIKSCQIKQRECSS